MKTGLVCLCAHYEVQAHVSIPSHADVFVICADGAGADGSATPRFAAYGATKRSLAQLGKSLEAELKLLGVKNVGVHNLSPGMVSEHPHRRPHRRHCRRRRCHRHCHRE